MESDPDKLLERHAELVHCEMQKVISHVQRKDGDWIVNTVMIEGHDVPFRYKRKQVYRSLEGTRVNLTCYPATHEVAGIEMEIMKVVRIRRA